MDVNAGGPTEHMSHEHSTLRNYIAVLRRRKLVIIGIGLIAAAVALALSLTQSKTYTASSSFRVQEEAEAVGVGGLLPAQGDFPTATAAQAAETATRDEVLKAVIKQVKVRGSVDDIRDDVSAVQATQSNLVDVSANASTAEGAAALANATASEAAKLTNKEAQRSFSQYADKLYAQQEKVLAGIPDSPVAELGPVQQQIISQQLNRAKQLGDNAAKLESLGLGLQLAKVTDTATPPDSPSAPKPIRDGIIGLIVGLILGMAVAGLLESLDRRLRRPDDAQALFDYPLVGVVARESMGMVPIGNAPGEPEVVSMDSFRMLRTNVRFLSVDDPPRSILVTSPVPEEGKTTVAIGVALAGAAAGMNTLLVEADLHRPVHAARLGLNERPGLADYLAGPASPQQVLQVREFVEPAIAQRNGTRPKAPSQLVCVTAGELSGFSAEILGSERFADFLQKVKKVYDLVVIDSAPLLAVAETSQIVPLVDAVMLCVRLGKTTAEQARAGGAALGRLPERPTGLVLTGVTPDSGDGYSYYSYAYSYRFGRPKQTA
jgi:capsular exopolysaccharide synthesis family protein